ncbi:helix-turn-helix domain-containing protein [Fangia hongkongensis]|nr:helix-turn-helix transcriptional regulator [Fangia hongkongensis]MBK2126369.1 helix-turn-helix transcriptional regulator [Fangia hongkongensis]
MSDKQNTVKIISHNIFALMKKHQIKSVSELARQINCSATTLYNITNHANKNPSIETIKMITDFFDISIDAFISENLFTQSSKKSRACPLLDIEHIAAFYEGKLDASDIAVTEISNTFVSEKAFAIRLNKNITPYQQGNILIFDALDPYEISFPNLCLLNIGNQYLIENTYFIDNELYIKESQGFLTKKEVLVPINEKHQDCSLAATLIEVKFYN